nr:reverse transcriptase domain-containing protein [Tanacetum cinerariifolium]
VVHSQSSHHGSEDEPVGNRRTEQENEGLNNKLSLIESAHFGCESLEKELTDVVKDLEKDRDESEEEIAGLLAETKDLDIEGSKSLETKHRELFSKQYPYVQKVTDSYLLPMADLLSFRKIDRTCSMTCIDFMGPFPNSKGKKYILIAVDYLSKWVEAKALPTNDARVVVKFLKSLFSRFGTPKAIISVHGTHFCNDQFAKVMSKYGVTHRLSTAYHPQTSGHVEVTNRVSSARWPPESSRVVVIPKFDMHIYTSELTSTELKDDINEYCIPIDLHPCLPHPGMTMNRLPSRYIDAMPWRHSDTDLHDDFPTHFNEDDVALSIRVSVISMDTFLKLPTWTETVVSKGDPLPEDQRPKPRVTPPLPVGAPIPALTPFQKNLEKPNPKIAVAREKKDQQSLARAKAKRAGTGATEGPKKKQIVQKNIKPTRSGSEDTLYATPLNQAISETVPNPATVAFEVPPQVEKEVVDLSGNTRVSSPPVIDVLPSSRLEHHDTHENTEDEPVGNRYVPNWRLHNDLRVCTFRACKELVSHLATLVGDEFLGALSNVEVISRAYQTLGQSVVAQGELLKRHEQLNHDYVDLRNRNDAHLLELGHLRSIVRRTEKENEGLNNKLSLIESAHSGYGSREKELTDVVKDLERERDEWRVTASNQVE